MLSAPTTATFFELSPTAVRPYCALLSHRITEQIKHGDSVAVYGGGIRISDSVLLQLYHAIESGIFTVMSIRASSERTILMNLTNMEERRSEARLEIRPGGQDDDDDEVRETSRKADPTTPPATKAIVLDSTMNALPHGDVGYCRNRPANPVSRKDSQRSMYARSGSGSGDPDPCHPEDGGDPAAKKRKTRRGKPKHRKLKPYSKQQMSYGQRVRSSRGLGRLIKTVGQPPAPYNTTQFLMEDHSDLPDLEQKLADAITSDVTTAFQKPLAPPRTRDSSFSIDSDEDYFYSSPEDEEEFLTKEFSSAYEDLHAERLSTMTKSELIQEYVQLEAKLDIMTKRLKGKGLQTEERESQEAKNGSSTSSTTDAEVAKKLKICQQRIDDLIQQNEQLRRDNESLRANSRRSPVSSVDSESDSDSSSSNRSSCCSASGQSGDSTVNEKGFQQRKEHRRCKRQSSVESNSSTSSKDSTANGKERKTDGVNGSVGSMEVGGLPT